MGVVYLFWLEESEWEYSMVKGHPQPGTCPGVASLCHCLCFVAVPGLHWLYIVCISQDLSECKDKIFFLAISTGMRYFLIFPNDENTGPLTVKQTCSMLIQRPFPKVNCLINTQIVPSTHYKFAICLIYAQSGRSCKYNAKSRHLELLLLLLFSLCNCLQ